MYSLNISETIHCFYFGRMKQTKGWEHNGRSLLQNLLVLIIDGEAEFQFAETSYALQTGDVLIIPANTLYKAHTNESCEYYFYHFSGQLRPSDFSIPTPISLRFSFRLSPIEDPCIYFLEQTHTGQNFRQIYNSVIACTDYHARGSTIGQRMLECEFLKILLILTEIAEQRHSDSQPAALNRMIFFIKKNLTRAFGMEELCNACGISASYAGRLFKKHLRMTVTEYVNSEKLYYARELINNTGMNLTEIAEYLGYCDVFYFSKRFKRKFGISPSLLKKCR